MAVSKNSLPSTSILNRDGGMYDYVDSFQADLTDKGSRITSTEVGKAFFTSGPKWIENLMDLRNKLVSVFGLKTSGKIHDKQAQLDAFSCEPGEQLGIFKVFAKTDQEVVLGEDDKHLNFRVSLLLTPHISEIEIKTVTISTVVKFNNWFGRLYFLPVRPFHKRIVPSMLKGVIKKLEENQNT